MTLYFVLAQSDATALALDAVRKLLRARDGNDLNSCPQPIVINRGSSVHDLGLQTYHAVSERIEREAKENGSCIALNSVVILVDSIRPESLSAIQDSGWENLIALLILSFPEIKWVFGTTAGRLDMEGDSLVFPVEEHSIDALINKPRRDPLFDPTRLREWVRRTTSFELEEVKQVTDRSIYKLPRREHLAAAIEDEESYAYYHGYAAYRFGFGTDVITSYELMKTQFQQQEQDSSLVGQASPRTNHEYYLLLEDMRLEFSDKPWDVGLSCLREFYPKRGEFQKLKTDEGLRRHIRRVWSLFSRQCVSASSTPSMPDSPNPSEPQKSGRAGYLPLLGADDPSTWRILITTGTVKDFEDSLIAANEAFLQLKEIEQGKKGNGRKIVWKPLGGILDLWMECLLYDGLVAAPRKGNAPGFEWPPKFNDTPSERAGHGAPGKLLAVAERLLRRAEAARNTAVKLQDYVTACVLAADSSELVNGRSPTTTLTAVALRHECEVKAECDFFGVAFQIKGLERRLEEVELESEAVCDWFHKDIRLNATLNAQAGILNRLVMGFREAGQVDEEMKCLAKLRSVNREMTLRQKAKPIASLCSVLEWPRGIFEWISEWCPLQLVAQGILVYSEWLLSSFNRFPLAIAGWLVILTLLAWWVDPARYSIESLLNSTTLAFKWFFGEGETFGTNYRLYYPTILISWIGVLAGYLHLGILISYLYSLASRK